MTRLRYPDFLGIGAQKAGTSWLYQNLRHHPAVWMPLVKEIHYFNEVHDPPHRRWIGTHRDRHVRAALARIVRNKAPDSWNLKLLNATIAIATEDADDAWYGRVFAVAGNKQLVGEITPGYARLPDEGVAHVRRLLGPIKVIYILRDPIDRAWSQIRMHFAGDPEFAHKAISLAQSNIVLSQADYIGTLAKWRAHFGTNNILIEFYDNIVCQPTKVLQRVCEFLQVRYKEEYFPYVNQQVNMGQKIDIAGDLYEILREILLPYYQSMLEILPNPGLDWYRKHYSITFSA